MALSSEDEKELKVQEVQEKLKKVISPSLEDLEKSILAAYTEAYVTAKDDGLSVKGLSEKSFIKPGINIKEEMENTEFDADEENAEDNQRIPLKINKAI